MHKWKQQDLNFVEDVGIAHVKVIFPFNDIKESTNLSLAIIPIHLMINVVWRSKELAFLVASLSGL
jgi:hypothetical protein